MKFWLCISTGIAVFVIGLRLLPTPTHYEWKAPPWARVAAVLLMALAVAMVWAIIFRRQVEKLQASIYSILVLLAMQAILFWAIQRNWDY
jgi:hypothetical protein